MLLLSLFWSFLQIGLFSIGGGYAAMPLIQEQVVTLHGWLDVKTFGDLVVLAEMTPGPIAINAATFVGTRVAGLPGALVATAGFLLPSLILVSVMAFLYRKYRTLDAVQSVLSLLRAAVVAMIASAGVSILLQVVFCGSAMSLAAVEWQGAALFAAALIALRTLKKCSPILVMLLCGGVALLLGVAFPGI